MSAYRGTSVSTQSPLLTEMGQLCCKKDTMEDAISGEVEAEPGWVHSCIVFELSCNDGVVQSKTSV